MTSSEKNIQTVIKLFKEYLENNKHRKTPERFAILREIYYFDGHFDMDTLYSLMKRKKYRVSRATLYNTMELLLLCNLVVKHQFGKNTAHYERSFKFRQHDHLICNQCGKVLEFCDPRLQHIQDNAGKMLGFIVTNHSLNLYADCEELLKTQKCSKQQAS